MSCVSRAILRHSAEISPGSDVQGLTFAGGGDVRLGGQTTYLLSMVHQFRVVKAEAPRGPFKVSTMGYYYRLQTEGGHEVVAFHWHPGVAYSRPHLHLGHGLGRLRARASHYHFPTGRVCLEEVLRFAIQDLLVRPRRNDWETVLDTSQRAHEEWRTWPRPTA